MIQQTTCQPIRHSSQSAHGRPSHCRPTACLLFHIHSTLRLSDLLTHGSITYRRRERQGSRDPSHRGQPCSRHHTAGRGGHTHTDLLVSAYTIPTPCGRPGQRRKKHNHRKHGGKLTTAPATRRRAYVDDVQRTPSNKMHICKSAGARGGGSRRNP